MSQQDEFDLNEFERELEALFTASEDEPEEEEAPVEEPEEETSDDGEDGADEEEGDESSSEAEAEEEAPPTTVRVGDRDLSQADAAALVEFYDWVRANPQQAYAIDSYLKGEAQFVVPGQEQRPAPEPEPEIDEDLDPAVRAKLAEIDALKQRVDGFEQQRVQSQQVEIQAAIIHGTENFKTRYALTDEEVAELQQIGADLNVAPGLAQQKGFTAAVEETLEMAYWRTEKYRDAAVARYAAQQSQDEKRQKKASSISGGSGSVPRTPKAPSTNEDRREGMVQAIAQAMQPTSQE